MCSRTRVTAVLFLFGARSERNRELKETDWLVDEDYGKGRR